MRYHKRVKPLLAATGINGLWGPANPNIRFEKETISRRVAAASQGNQYPNGTLAIPVLKSLIKTLDQLNLR